jgi:hypothetical protein
VPFFLDFNHLTAIQFSDTLPCALVSPLFFCFGDPICKKGMATSLTLYRRSITKDICCKRVRRPTSCSRLLCDTLPLLLLVMPQNPSGRGQNHTKAPPLFIGQFVHLSFCTHAGPRHTRGHTTKSARAICNTTCCASSSFLLLSVSFYQCHVCDINSTRHMRASLAFPSFIPSTYKRSGNCSLQPFSNNYWVRELS